MIGWLCVEMWTVGCQHPLTFRVTGFVTLLILCETLELEPILKLVWTVSRESFGSDTKDSGRCKCVTKILSISKVINRKY